MGSDPLSCSKEPSYLMALLFGLFFFVCFFGGFFETLAGTAPLWLVVVKHVISLSSWYTLETPSHLQIHEDYCTKQFSVHQYICLCGCRGVASHSMHLMPSSLEIYVRLFVLPLQLQILLQPSVRRTDSSRTNVILLTLAKYSVCKLFHLIQAFTFFKRDYSWPVTPHKTWMSLVYYCFPVEWVTNAEHLTVMPESL